jgi:gas vesicle protein
MAPTVESGIFGVGTFGNARFGNVSFEENVSVSEDFDSKAIYVKILEDSVSVSEERTNNISKQLEDNISISEDFVRQANLFRTLLENISISEDLSKEAQKNLTENISVNDEDIQKNIYKLLSDSLNIDEDISKSTTKNISDSLSVSENISKETRKKLQEQVSITESFVKTIYKNITDSVSITDDGLVLTWILDLVDNVSITDDGCFNRIDKAIQTIKDDFESVLTDVMNESVDLVKQTTTTNGGFIDDISHTKFCVQCRIMPVSQRDRQMLPTGIMVTGTMTGYFYPTYTFKGNTYVVEENDEIYDAKKDIRYRVVSTPQREHLNNEVIYIKATLRRI